MIIKQMGGKVVLKCESCGNIFERWKCHIKKNNHVFCSLDCCWVYRKNYCRKLEPSSELTYLIGAFLGDGWVHNKKCYTIGFAGEQSFMESINEKLSKVIGRTYLVSKSKTKNMYVLFVYSKSFYNFLNLPIEKLLEITERYPLSFIRGFFEAEGTVIKDRRKKHVYLLRMTNTNYLYIKTVGKYLKKFGFDYGIIESKRKEKNWKTIYHLQLRGGFFSIRRFINLVKPKNKIPKELMEVVA